MMDSLRKLQLTQLEILKVVDEFCSSNGIVYSLYAGTLLGAVRHKGFIPWDDDLDICMPRSDYQKFLELWRQKSPKGYYLQNHETDSLFPQTFSKIRKENTTYITNYDRGRGYRTGIFIDIFPVDRINPKFVYRHVFWFYCIEYQLLIHGFSPDNTHVLVKVIADLILKVYSGERRTKRIKKLFKHITKYNQNLDFPLVLTETVVSMKKLYPSHLFQDMCRLDFEDGQFMAFKEWDRKLSIDFGDYMQLPPLNERKQLHKPLVLDFDKEII